MTAPQSTEQKLYYMQTKGFSGDSLLWWRDGKHGYTTDIKRAHVWTSPEMHRDN